MLQNSFEKPKHKIVLVYFISVLVLCAMRILCIGLLSRHVSFLNNVLFALSQLFLFCILIFHVFPQALHLIITDLKC